MSPIQLQAYGAQMHVEDYETLEKIACSERAVVCRVVCKRGRLRGREVALKKSPFISSSTNGSTEIPAAMEIHQSLHHPNIISLYSAFLDHCSLYLVLELCPSGNLLDHITSRDPPTLSEHELRCILKGLVDALIYLRKELVLHRKIDLSRILLTENHKVKLSGFDHAVRMSSQDSKFIPCTEISELQKFIAPEILSNAPSGFAVDVWSLGCVALACISSSFRTMVVCVDPISKTLCDISKGFSAEANDFIGGLLQMDPENRTHVFYMPSHPFFHADAELSTSLQSLLIEQQPRLIINKPRIKRCLSSGVQFPRKKSTLADVGNFGLKNMLTNPSRRVVSNPIPRKPLPFLARSTEFSRRANMISEVAKNNPHRAESDRTSTATILDDYDLDNDLPDQVKMFDEPSHERARIPPIPFQYDEEYEYKQPKLEVNQIADTVPIGTTRPSPLNTFLLGPKTHKSSYGHITVLPSYSLLVDFRESQRRRKLDGTEVLVISPDGEEIKIYSAPHLSIPCCLVEPSQIYSIQALPRSYWRQYNDAANILDQVKRRTPEFIQYSPRAKCMLMANGPIGDIEILFDAARLPSETCPKPKPSSPKMRLRFSRQNTSLEFARHITSDTGEEWMKKVMPFSRSVLFGQMSHAEQLDDLEKDAIQELKYFLSVSEAVETLRAERRTMMPTSRDLPTAEGTKLKSPSTENLNHVHPATYSYNV